MGMWKDLGPARINDYHDIHEYIVGDMTLLASPKDLLLIENEMEHNTDFAVLIWAFRNPTQRRLMFARMWQFVDTMLEYRLKTKSGPYVAAYGTKGMGKSEVLSAILLRILVFYNKFTEFNAVPALARNPSEGNTLLAMATKAGVKLVLHIDEAEYEMGLGSGIEENALDSNLETIRVLIHTVLRCTIRLKKIKGFVEQCDFVLHTIFQDRVNRLNYCMVYIYNEKRDMLEAVGIIDIPMHKNERFREMYEERKERDQIDFTKSFGRTSPMLKRIEPIVVRLVDKVFELKRERDISTHGDLEAMITRRKYGTGGWILNSDERRLAMKHALDEIKERLQGHDESQQDDHRLKEYIWESDFSWRLEIASLLKDHPRHKKHYPFFIAYYIEMLQPDRDAEAFHKITGVKRNANYDGIRRLKNDSAFDGWWKYERSVLHELFVVQKLRSSGIEVISKPEFVIDSRTYQEDLKVIIDGREIWINAKCGDGLRTYTFDEYKTTYLLHTKMGKEAYILYLDCASGVHTLYIPKESVSVGASKGEYSDFSDPSTPITVLRALGTDGSEAPQHSLPPPQDIVDAVMSMRCMRYVDDEKFMDSCRELVRVSGTTALGKVLRKKRLRTKTIDRITDLLTPASTSTIDIDRGTDVRGGV